MGDTRPRLSPEAATAPTIVEAATPCPLVKRLLDVVGSSAGLVLLAPLFGLLALLIKADSPGPVLFRQKRIGRGGEPFTMLKFRTMTDGNDSSGHKHYVQELINGGSEDLRNRDGAFKLAGDARITRIGRWLRATSLDELPQLLNVLKGEMSLVGPRPPLDYEVELYSPRHARRLAVTPGITGLWQVSGRNELTFEEMVDLDIEYVDGWSPLLDARILLRTVSVVLTRKGA